MNESQSRPVYLNLLRIRQPVTAVVSILHRISGFLLIILLPGFIYLLQLSLHSPEGFARALSILEHPVASTVGIFICWMYAHHFLAGIRFLLLDFDIGISRESARKTAWLVHIGAALFGVIAVGVLL